MVEYSFIQECQKLFNKIVKNTENYPTLVLSKQTDYLICSKDDSKISKQEIVKFTEFNKDKEIDKLMVLDINNNITLPLDSEYDYSFIDLMSDLFLFKTKFNRNIVIKNNNLCQQIVHLTNLDLTVDKGVCEKDLYPELKTITLFYPKIKKEESLIPENISISKEFLGQLISKSKLSCGIYLRLSDKNQNDLEYRFISLYKNSFNQDIYFESTEDNVMFKNKSLINFLYNINNYKSVTDLETSVNKEDEEQFKHYAVEYFDKLGDDETTVFDYLSYLFLIYFIIYSLQFII